MPYQVRVPDKVEKEVGKLPKGFSLAKECMEVLEVKIRSVTPSDKAFLADIQFSNWPAGTWWGDGYQERLELAFRVEPEGLFLTEVSSSPVGWSWAMAIGLDGPLEIGTIVLVSVIPSYWGAGYRFASF